MADDKTGWILACASGLACVVGSSIICLDLLTRQVPRWKHFSIRESTTFLSASLSLSFGVMFYSALYGMLPKAHSYFLTDLSSSAAAYATIGCFLAGVAGLQLVSDALHHLLPSSIVNCEEHSGSSSSESKLPPSNRDLEAGRGRGGQHHHHLHHHDHSRGGEEEVPGETTPLLPPQLLRKPSIKQKLSGFVKCAADGTCYGYTDHFCEQSCNPETLLPTPSPASSISVDITDSTPTVASGSRTPPPSPPPPPQLSQHARHSHVHTSPTTATTPGHHHVANNKFLSIGVQTSLAIALHKIPEGFITYATNHASPSLGLSVFLALFIHNIAEGFIMALPLFLALRSRVKAVACASVLGGLSQPLGAGLAALAMRKGSGGEEEGGAAYGVLFAGTAGVMASVGVALFVQAVALKHGSRVPFVFGFVGMGVLGLSFALTADR